jgi:outer membrane lipoprotein SlyB
VAKPEEVIGGAIAGGTLGALVDGPRGALVGALAGALVEASDGGIETEHDVIDVQGEV